MKTFNWQRIPESSWTRKKTVVIDILMQPIRIKHRPSTRRRWNQFSQLKRTSTKVMPIEKTCTGYALMMTQAFKRGSNWEHQPRHDNSILSKAVWHIYRDKEQPQE